MKNIISLALLVASFGLFATSSTAKNSASTHDAKTPVACGPENATTVTDTFLQVGEKCTSSHPTEPNPNTASGHPRWYKTAKKQEAVNDANWELKRDLDGRYYCIGCPEGETGCENSGGVDLNPDPAFTMADCTFNDPAGPGDTYPSCGFDRRKILATCKKEITFTYECSSCTTSGGGGGGGGGGQ